jgi:GR25 family glycosyltransferase involved in LPS biosynthesis
MPLSLKTETIAIGTVVGIAVVLLILFLASYAMEGERPFVATAHVINLDRDAKKLESFRKQPLSSLLPVPVERWTATYGKDLNPLTLPAQGIGNLTVCAGKGTYKEQWKELRNQGAIGCFLSHRSLLQHCATLQVPDTAGHLILEDDALFADDFRAKWEAVRHHIPIDWDIVYLGVNTPKGHSIGKGVSKLYAVRDSTGNWGTHGYMVRHGALRTKILPQLRFMFEAVDGQFNAFFDEWNCYAITPQLITVDKSLGSTIQKM